MTCPVYSKIEMTTGAACPVMPRKPTGIKAWLGGTLKSWASLQKGAAAVHPPPSRPVKAKGGGADTDAYKLKAVPNPAATVGGDAYKLNKLYDLDVTLGGKVKLMMGATRHPLLFRLKTMAAGHKYRYSAIVPIMGSTRSVLGREPWSEG